MLSNLWTEWPSRTFLLVDLRAILVDNKNILCRGYAKCVPRSRVDSFVSIWVEIAIAPGDCLGNHIQIYDRSVAVRDGQAHSDLAANQAR